MPGAVGNSVIAVRTGVVVGVTGRASTTGAMMIGIIGFTTGLTGTTGVTTFTSGICVVVILTRPLVVGSAENEYRSELSVAMTVLSLVPLVASTMLKLVPLVIGPVTVTLTGSALPIVAAPTGMIFP